MFQEVVVLQTEYWPAVETLLLALLAGGLIGLERSINGRPAGFRTHALVCVSSALLMLLTVYQIKLLPDIPIESVRIDPTRMAQGIMTGIGFLGAGVIMKEGLAVRGLTTAASIWITASIGILVGIGFYYAAAVGTLITLGTLSVFRYLEDLIPTLGYARLHVRTSAGDAISEDELCTVIKEHDMRSHNISYYLQSEGKFIEYRMTLRTRHNSNFQKLASALNMQNKVLDYSLTPIGG
jgi:putative Mg2+ transporter-C (MgtC) family protein